MTVSEILAGGARLLRTQPRAVAIWGLVYLTMTAMMVGAMWPMFDGLAAFQAQAVAAQGGQGAPPAFPAGFVGAILLGNVVMVLGLAAIFAAAVRAVAYGGHDRYAFLRVGMDEARLVGLALLLLLIGFAAMIALILAIVAIALIVAIIAGVTGAGEAGGGAMVAVVVALYVGLIVLTVWAQTRISLAGAFTVLRGRVVIREAWRATAGQFWTLFGAYLAIGLVFVVISVVVGLALNPDMFATMTAVTDPAAAEAAMARQIQGMFGPRWFAFIGVGTVLNVTMTAFAFGAIVTAALSVDRDLYSAVAPA